MYEEELYPLSVRLLDEVECVIGYARGTLPFRSRPFLCRSKEDAVHLLFDHFSGSNLTRYLLTKEFREKKVAILVKGCDARTITVLLKEGQVKRENLVIVGLSCYGMVSLGKLTKRFGPLQVKDFTWHYDTFVFKGETMSIGPFLEDVCQRCLYPNPPIFDYLVGPKVEYVPRERWNNDLLTRLERVPVKERWEFFSQEFERCIRCYACRNACPLCYCKECFAEAQRPAWVSPAATRSENLFFHVGRTLHMAGRCVECGACERACPLDIPIALLPLKVEELVREHFAFEAGVSLEKEPPLLTYRENDPNEFIK